MRILYISTLASQDALEDARKKDPSFSAYAVQKFNRLIAEGLVKNGCEVSAMSTFYLPKVGHGYSRKKEIEKGVSISYIPTPNCRPLRVLWLTIYTFFRVLFWSFKNRKNKTVICDALNISACMGSIAACKLGNIPCVGIMTDMPGIGVGSKKNSKAARVNRCLLERFTHYVFLTEQMNEVINTKQRPYIVMEGLVDSDMTIPDGQEKCSKKIVIYAGGLYERYGLRMLVEAFIKANIQNSELWLYGSGPFVEKLHEYNKKDSRIIYKGIRPNREVVDAELKATLLVNPRPTEEEFTLYSFPSKNMEYMLSGTPLLTTKLPGMPTEYYPYVYLFDKGESVDGFASVIKEVLSLPDEVLQAKGMDARQWVLQNKNSIKQTAMIIELLNE